LLKALIHIIYRQEPLGAGFVARGSLPGPEANR